MFDSVFATQSLIILGNVFPYGRAPSVWVSLTVMISNSYVSVSWAINMREKPKGVV